MKYTKRVLLTLFLLLITFYAHSQVTTSSIAGFIVDTSGEPLAGAAVIAVHTPSGTQYYSLANEKGRFNLNGMRAGGPYDVEISFIGMTPVVYNSLMLNLGETTQLDVELKPSMGIDAAVVSVDRSFSSSLTGAGSTYDSQVLANVPTVDRSVYDVVKYSPLVTQVGNSLSFTGTNNRYNNFQIDGAEANDSFGLTASGTNGGMTGANPISMDALDEVQVSVAPFDVRQSGFTGGAINAVTKSGTNEVTGSAYSYFNNQDFIGVTPGKLAEGTERSRYSTQTSQIYGFTLGAPVVKDKLFVFVSAEYDRESSPNVYTPSSTYYNNFDESIATQILNHYAANYTVGVTGINENFAQRNLVNHSLNALARIDWNISDKHKLMFRYQLLDAKADKNASGASSYYFSNSGYQLKTINNIAVLELNSRFSDIISNEFRASAVIVRDYRDVAYNGAAVRITTDGPQVNIGAEKNSGANSVNTDTYNISDNLSIFAGNHQITLGTHNDFYVFNNMFISDAFGSYEFSSLQDFLDNKIYKFSYSYADPAVTGASNLQWAATAYAARFGIYAQDEWTPNRNFSLTYGIRADIPVMFNKPTENKAFNDTELSRNTGEMVGVVPDVSILLSPRVGFRWFIDQNHKSLLRGGAGVFTGRIPFVWLVNAYNNTGVETKSLYKKNPASDLPLTSNPYEDIVKTELLPSSTSSTVNTLNSNFKYPQTFRANIGFDHTFCQGWKFVFDAMYSKSFNNIFFNNITRATSSERVVAAVDAATAESNPSSIMAYYDKVSDYENVIALQNTNLGYSYSLSGQLIKHFDFGLDLMASYTFGHSYSVNDGLASKALSNSQAYVATDSTIPSLSYSYFDKPHKVQAMVSYTSPVYARIMSTTITLNYLGQSGNRYSYMTFDSADVNQSGAGGFLMYIPTADEVNRMSWAKEGMAAEFERFISNDKYLNSHRGQYSERFGGISPFEHRIDLHIAQDFYYNKNKGPKIQAIVDFINIGNMLNPEWGIVDDYSSSLHQYRQILNISRGSVTTEGKYQIPTYEYKGYDLGIEDFASRWRCQIGLRVTF